MYTMLAWFSHQIILHTFPKYFKPTQGNDCFGSGSIYSKICSARDTSSTSATWLQCGLRAGSLSCIESIKGKISYPTKKMVYCGTLTVVVVAKKPARREEDTREK